MNEAARAITHHPERSARHSSRQVRLSNQLCMLAYRILDEDCLKLLSFGPSAR
ncbi:hypothetical protein [Nitrosomonas eutropha]|uniref:hypothetical protein n=1 Tax=Nitrosomonas eutropha TaxID=916 RepID=UPI0002E764DB